MGLYLRICTHESVPTDLYAQICTHKLVPTSMYARVCTHEPVPQICTYVRDCTHESIPTGLYARACTHEPVHTDLYEGGCGMKKHFSHRNSHGTGTGQLKMRRNHALRCQWPIDRKMVKGDT